jgi:hypothetical protein
MSTINSAIHGLLSGRNNTASRMRRVSLGILIYLIWEERNKRVFDNSCNPVPFFFTDSRFYFTWFYTFMNSFLAAGVFWLGKLVCMAVMHPFGVWLCYLSYFDAVANSFFFFYSGCSFSHSRCLYFFVIYVRFGTLSLIRFLI